MTMQKQIAIALWSLAAACVLALVLAAIDSGGDFRSLQKRASTEQPKFGSAGDR